LGVADWDWENNKYALNADYKVEGTSSLRFTGDNSNLSRHTATQNLTHGMVETYVSPGPPEISPLSWIYVHFYNQAPLGSSKMENCYRFYIWFEAGSIRECYFEEIVAGAKNRTWPLNLTQTWTGWQKKRFIWYVKDGILYAYIEHWTGTEWVKDSDVIVITDPLWLESSVKRVGLAGGYTYPPYFDATSIYEIIP